MVKEYSRVAGGDPNWGKDVPDIEVGGADFDQLCQSGLYEFVVDLSDRGENRAWKRDWTSTAHGKKQLETIPTKLASALQLIIRQKGTFVPAPVAYPGVEDEATAVRGVGDARTLIDYGGLKNWRLIQNKRRQGLVPPSYYFAPKSDATYYIMLPGSGPRAAVPIPGDGSAGRFVKMVDEETGTRVQQCYGFHFVELGVVLVGVHLSNPTQALSLDRPYLVISGYKFRADRAKDDDFQDAEPLATAMPADGISVGPPPIGPKKYSFLRYLVGKSASIDLELATARIGPDAGYVIGELHWHTETGDGDRFFTRVALREHVPNPNIRILV